MGKKRNRRKQSILPLIAVGVGVYLLTRQKASPIVKSPALPTYNPSAPAIQRIWPQARIPQYI